MGNEKRKDPAEIRRQELREANKRTQEMLAARPDRDEVRRQELSEAFKRASKESPELGVPVVASGLQAAAQVAVGTEKEASKEAGEERASESMGEELPKTSKKNTRDS